VSAFRLLLEYDGAEFEGWQVQPRRRTVQGELEKALRRITGKRCRVTGAGRTDAGVHAEGQVASVVVATHLAPDSLRRALNAVLPKDLAVLALEPAPDGFDARRDARSKLYRYAIWNAPTRSPLRLRTHWNVRTPLDLDAMRAAAAHLVGERDFAALRASGGGAKTSVRTLSRVEIAGEPGGAVRLEFEGTGFLRHMVRNAVGTLVDVGRGRRPPASVAALLAGGDRRAAGPTAPAHGLSLVWVDYGKPRRDRGLSRRPA
jgi:tRNA pseudouridine38-40 synthase